MTLKRSPSPHAPLDTVLTRACLRWAGAEGPVPSREREVLRLRGHPLPAQHADDLVGEPSSNCSSAACACSRTGGRTEALPAAGAGARRSDGRPSAPRPTWRPISAGGARRRDRPPAALAGAGAARGRGRRARRHLPGRSHDTTGRVGLSAVPFDAPVSPPTPVARAPPRPQAVHAAPHASPHRVDLRRRASRAPGRAERLRAVARAVRGAASRCSVAGLSADRRRRGPHSTRGRVEVVGAIAAGPSRRAAPGACARRARSRLHPPSTRRAAEEPQEGGGVAATAISASPDGGERCSRRRSRGPPGCAGGRRPGTPRRSQLASERGKRVVDECRPRSDSARARSARRAVPAHGGRPRRREDVAARCAARRRRPRGVAGRSRATPPNARNRNRPPLSAYRRSRCSRASVPRIGRGSPRPRANMPRAPRAHRPESQTTRSAVPVLPSRARAPRRTTATLPAASSWRTLPPNTRSRRTGLRSADARAADAPVLGRDVLISRYAY